ncbi:nucleotidyltransferase [Hyphobacterium sp. CCMP332]|nr:nucleotidyltransferase [Hyphobacterium sp. CCMP332]
MDLFVKEFIYILHELLNNKVKFVLLGGLAVNLYGYRRATSDMDILFEASEDNSKRLINSLEKMGYDTSSIASGELQKKINFRLGEPGLSVDFMNATKGIDYDEVFQNAKIFEIENLKVPVIHINHLIENKIALNTFKDLDDAEKLKEIRFNLK